MQCNLNAIPIAYFNSAKAKHSFLRIPHYMEEAALFTNIVFEK